MTVEYDEVVWELDRCRSVCTGCDDNMRCELDRGCYLACARERGIDEETAIEYLEEVERRREIGRQVLIEVLRREGLLKHPEVVELLKKEGILK